LVERDYTQVGPKGEWYTPGLIVGVPYDPQHDQGPYIVELPERRYIKVSSRICFV